MQLFKKIFDIFFYGGLEDWSFSLSISFSPFLRRGLFFRVHLCSFVDSPFMKNERSASGMPALRGESMKSVDLT